MTYEETDCYLQSFNSLQYLQSFKYHQSTPALKLLRYRNSRSYKKDTYQVLGDEEFQRDQKNQKIGGLMKSVLGSMTTALTLA